MADIRVIKTGTDTYTITKDGKAYTAKDTNGDGKLTKADGNAFGLSDGEWSSIETAQAKAVQTNPVNKPVSLFSEGYQSSGNTFSYDTMWAGNTISYPSTPLSAMNDRAVWNYADSVSNMPAMLGGMVAKMQAFLQQMEATNMQSYLNMMNKISGGTGSTSSTTSSTSSTTGSASSNGSNGSGNGTDCDEIGKLRKELEELKKLLISEKTEKNKSALEIEKQRANADEIELESDDIARKIYKAMDGPGTDDKALKFNITEKVTQDNVIEVMDRYDEITAEYGQYDSMFTDIFDDHRFDPGKAPMEPALKYYANISAKLAQRAQRILDAQGEDSNITQEQIDKFKADVKANNKLEMVEIGRGTVGDNTTDMNNLEAVVNNFRNLIKNAEAADKLRVAEEATKQKETK